MVFVKNLKLCLQFVLCKIHREKTFGDVLVTEQAFLDDTNNDLKTTQNWHFSKGDSHDFGQKDEDFSCFVFIKKRWRKYFR